MKLTLAKNGIIISILLMSAPLFVAPAQAVEMPLLPATVAAVQLDTDRDGLPDVKELTIYFTDPFKADTDGDGFKDNAELKNGFSPRHGKNVKLLEVDSDKDGMNDGWELSFGTGLMNTDTDGDGVKDGKEVKDGTDPRDPKPVKLAKLIKVDVSKHHLTYYLGDRPLESFAISAGTAKMPTPVGEYTVMKKLPSVRYKGADYDFPNTKWNMLFTRVNGYGYYVHGAYWHDNWGRGMSHGCVNVKYDRMERLYAWADVGTKVVTTLGKD